MLKKIITVFSIIIIIFLSLYFLLGIYFNESEFADDFLKKTAEETSIRIDYNSIRFGLVPRPGIILSDIIISDLNSSETILTSKRIRISIKIIRLLTGKILPGTVIIDSPSLTLKRDKDGNLILPEFFKKRNKASSSGKKSKKTKSQSISDSFEIINGSLSYEDNFLSPSQTFIFSGIDFTVHKKFFFDDYSFILSFLCKNGKSNPAFFELKGETGTINLKNLTETAINLKAKIRTLELKPFEQYISALLPFESIGETINADLELKSDCIKDGFKLTGNLNCTNLNFVHKRLFLNPLISKKASINFSIEKSPEKFSVSNYHLQFDRFAVDGAVDFSRINNNESNLYLNFSTNNFPYDDYGLNFIPFKIFKTPLRRFMLDRIKGGTVDLRNLTINLPIHKDKSHKYAKKPDFFTLDATVKNLSFLFGDIFKPVEVNTGIIKIKNGEALFTNAEGQYGKGKWRLLSGEIKDLYHKSELSVKAEGNLPSVEITDFLKEGPLPPRVKDEASNVNDSLGNATLTLTINKTLSEHKAPLIYNGVLIADSLKAYHKDFKSQFDISDATAIFSNQRVELNIKDITYSDSHIFLSGVIIPSSSRNKKLYSSILLEGSLSAPLLLEMSNKYGTGNIDLNGFVHFKSVLEQRGYDNINYSFESEITDINLKYKSIFIKKALQPSSLKLYFHYLSDNLLIKKGSEIEIENNKFNINGEYEKGNTYPLRLNISSDKIDTKTLSKNIPSLKRLSPEGNAGLKLRFSLADSNNFKAKTNVKLKKMSSNAGILDLVRSGSGVIEKKAEHIIFRNFKVKALGSSFNIDGGMDNEGEGNNVVLNIRTDSFNIDKLIKKYPQPKPHNFSGGKGKHISFDCMLNSGNTIFLGNNYEKTSADFSYDKNMLKITHIDSSAFDGPLTLSGKINFSSAKDSAFSICSESEKTDIDKLLNYLGVKGSEITGTIKITDCIESNWKKSDDIKPNLSGEVSFLSKNGKIRKTSIGVLSKILSFFNLLKWKDFWIKDIETKGMTYNTISADFSGDKGVFHTDNFILDGSSMKISAVGDIDVGKNTIDMKVAVMPLGTIDTLVSNIPIVGYILAGKDKSLVGAYFEVTGNLKDPDVKPVSTKSLGQGILGIFRRSLGFPYDMIKEIGSNNTEKTTESKEAPSQ